MDSETTILDDEIITREIDPRGYMASAGVRLVNYVVDIVLFYALVFLVGLVIPFMGINIHEGDAALQFVSLMFYFLYCFIFEASIGKTPAKFITRTRVVNDRGNLPGALTIAGRSLSRLVPFEPFSFLGGDARGWHDRWSNTWVIDERKRSSMRGSES